MRIGIIASLAGSAGLGLAALGVAHFSLPKPVRAAVPASLIPANTVPVVVAADALAYGQKLDAGHLKVEHLPAGAAPQGAYASIPAVLDQAGGAPVVLTAIAAREVILADKLSGPGARPSLAAQIADGKRAYTIRLSDVTGVGGHVLPGDYVDVILSREIADDTGGTHRGAAELVLQNVRVLSIDLNSDPSTTKAAIAANGTLEVTVAEAQKLALAAQSGLLSLALRRLGATDVASAAPVTTAAPATVRVAARLRPRSAPAHTASEIVVTQGGVTSRVQVASERREGDS
jgi:pilus assembly protein CpaB